MQEMESHFRAMTDLNRSNWEYPSQWQMQFFIITGDDRWASTHVSCVGAAEDHHGHVLASLPEQLKQALLDASPAHHYNLDFEPINYHKPDDAEQLATADIVCLEVKR